MQKETVKADILCIGGGPAGLMAAIRASEFGQSVVVADKSNTMYSGSGGAGNDHFACYIPEVHGHDPQPILHEYLHHPQTGIRPEFSQLWLENSFEIVKLWDSWGIPMKYMGRWEFAGHAFPGHPLIYLKYSGGNQKQVLTEQALKSGVQIINRVTVFEFLRDADRIVGALGFDTWNNRIIEFQAKAVFLGTGGCGRLYASTTPGWLFNTPMSPFATGDGRAMVYRVGGELRDMEFLGQWAGLKYFARSGKGTWIGVLRGPDDKPVGPFITKPDRVYGDVTSDCWTSVFDDYMHSGRGPVYMDCRGASQDDIEYMKHWLKHEGNKGILDEMDKEGIDPLKHAVEFCTYGIGVRGGVAFNTNGETSLVGLYSAGQEYSGNMAFATTLGWIAGENIAKYVKEVEYSNSSSMEDKTGETVAILESILNRKEGATWQEANMALQQIMEDYAGLVRSDTLLDQGLKNIGRLKKKAKETLVARNGHELGRCLEVLNLLDVGEAVLLCAKERKETRAKHNRTDFPFTNPLLNKLLIIRREDGKTVFDWRAK
jgi:succinate dehydrogenase/fumarate reductase flavoprotein subunit